MEYDSVTLPERLVTLFVNTEFEAVPTSNPTPPTKVLLTTDTEGLPPLTTKASLMNREFVTFTTPLRYRIPLTPSENLTPSTVSDGPLVSMALSNNSKTELRTLCEADVV